MKIWWCEEHGESATAFTHHARCEAAHNDKPCRVVEKRLVDMADSSVIGFEKTDGQWPRWAKLLAEDWARNFIDEFCDADDLFDHLAKEVR